MAPFAILISGNAFAQSIGGPMSVTTNQTYTYTFNNGTTYVGANWTITNGFVKTQTVSGTVYTSTVVWTSSGTGTLKFQNGGTVLSTLTATISYTALTAPTASGATSISNSSFTANWGSISAAQSYSLDVSTSSSFASFVAGYNGLSISSTSQSVTGLSPNTTYYYRVRSVNIGGSSSSSNVVTVLTAPSIPTATTASSLTNVSFTANWGSTGATSYSLDVSTDNAFSSFVSGYNGLSVSGTSQTVSSLSSNTTYYYRVRSVNSSGTSGNSNTVSVLTLLPAPNPAGPSSVISSSFTANWGAVSGATSYQLDVSTASDFSSFVSGYNNLSVSSSGTSQSVTGISMSNTTYYYRVRAVNASGASANSYTVTVVPLPGAPVVASATSMTTSSFTANWLAGNYANGYQLDVSLSSSFSSFVNGYNGLMIGNSTSATVTGLTPNTTYYYRVRSTNASGVSGNSNSTSVVTIPVAPTATAPTGVSQSSFIANWSSGSVQYQLDVSTASDFSSMVSGYNSLLLSNVTSYAVTGLSTGTTYYYRVRAVNASGASSSSNTISVLTFPAAPSVSAAGSITSSSFAAQWGAVPTATGYYLDVATDAGFTSILSGYNNLSVGSVTSQTVSGLTAGTIYYYRVRAFNGSGTSANSSNGSALTLPGAPTANNGTSITGSGFSANWVTVQSATSYRLDVALDNAFASFVAGYNNLGLGNVTSYSVTGLSTGITHYYRVRAVNASGSSSNSNTISVLTLPAAPAVSTASSITVNSFVAQWGAVPTATSYNLDVAIDAGFTAILSGYNNLSVGNATSQTVSGLTAGTIYYYRVRSVNSSGTSASSSNGSALTLPGAPVANSATSITTNSFSANWTAAQSATEYHIDVATDNTFSSILTGFNDYVVSTNSATISGLVQSSVYYYRVRAKNASGYSINSNIISVTTANQFDGQNVNFIVSNTLLIDNISSESSVKQLAIGQISQSIQYFDGLGRPVQSIVTQGSPSKNDLVQAVVYDAFSRENKKYLPFTSNTNGSTRGWFKNDPVGLVSGYTNSAQYQFYNNGTADKIIDDTMPYAETVFEPSPLNRPAQDFGAGAGWRAATAGTDKFMKHQYLVNNDGTTAGLEKIIAWALDVNGMPVRSTVANASVSGGFYTTGQLLIKSTIDEQNHEVREYTDKLGHIILKKVQAVDNATLNDPTHWTQTYYIYDDFGLLRYVLQPELVKTLVQNSTNPSTADLNNFAFQYKYDGRDRMIQKQVPGSGAVYMVYDLRDRLVMTQDANQRPSNQWLLTKYDAFNRPVVTALYTHGATVDQTGMSSLIDQVNFYETYNGVPATHGYSSNVWPTSGYSVLTAMYYDNYSFVTDLSLGSSYSFVNNDITGQETSNNTRPTGHPTGTKVNVLGSSNYLWNVTYYDSKYRTIQNIAQNNKSGWDRVTNLLDFPGRVLNTKTTHHTSTHSDQSVAHRFTYDHMSRKIKTYQSLNNEPNEMLLSQNNYNELGQLVDKNLHLLYDASDGQAGTLTADNIVETQYNGENQLVARNSVKLLPNYSVKASATPWVMKLTTVTQAQAEANGKYFQSVDYRYNIRGWLTSMNNSQLTNDGNVTNDDTNDLFGMQLGYNNGIGSGNAALYNGNISAMKWSSNLALGAVKDVAYNYSYDPLNRILGASYLTNTTGVWSNAANAFNESGYQYDQNGNIKNLIRNGSTGSTMDNLAYAYNGNQLLTVTDAGDVAKGFTDGNTTGNDYSYDVNGNMVSDKNKSLTATNAIQYNYLNLPVQVVKSTNEKIIYTYDAAGRKLTQQVYNASGAVTKTTEYDGAFIYQDDILQFINHEEGRIIMKGATPEYQYHLRDHLGNVRVTFTTQTTVKTYIAGFETSNQTTEGSNFSNYPTGAKINTVATNAHSGSNSYYLNGGYNGQVGLGKSLSVMPGDQVKLQAFAKYSTPSGTPANFTSFISSLLSAFNLSAPAPGETGTAASGVNAFGTWEIGASGDESKNDAMKIFATIILFDQNYNFIDVAYQAIQGDGSLNVNYTVKQPGYAYLYISNEHPYLTDVYFDDVTVTQTPSPLVQQEDFYPFGLTFNSYQRENSMPNKLKLFQGQEHVDDLGLNWDSFKWRNHMPDIGRFFNIDPLTDKYVYNSTYAFAENRVVSGRELEGLEWAPPMNADNNPDVQALEEYQHARADQGLGMVETVTDAAKGLYSLFTTDPRKSFNNLVEGIGTLISNPGAVKDAMVSSFNENPARFSGKIGGNIIMAAFTGGALNALKTGSVWELGAGARGMAIERGLGGNLPTNFPVIDRLSNGVATSIKSIDLTAKSYGKNGALLGTLKGYVNSLSNFSGATYGRTTISEGIDFTSKSLQVAIQPGKASLSQWEQISKAMKYAKNNGVQFNLQFVK
ncbi:MAG: hypothetical protein HYR67_02040 [Bacteroidetes bacterium]|nr:hypothetical protein [Bacteroidota bacterium]